MKHLDEGTLQAWLDMPRSGLDASEVADIERHLADCPTCSSKLEEVRGGDERVHSLLTSGLDRDVPRPPFEDVVARARVHRTTRRGLRRLNRMAWAASIVVALGVGWMSNEIFRGGGVGTPVQLAPAAEEPAVSAESPEQDLAAGSRSQSTRAVTSPSEPTAQSGAATPPPAALADAEPSLQPERAAEPGRGNENLVADAAPQAAPVADPARAGAAAAAPPAADEVRRLEDTDRARQIAAARERTTDGTVVTGVVRDGRSGEPVPAAQVFVPELEVGALTEEDGSYRLVVPRGSADSVRLDLVVQRIGYREERQAVSARAAEDVTADFILQEQALQLQEVVVSGTAGGVQRRAVGNAVATLEAVPIEWQPESREAIESTLGESLLTVPGRPLLSVESAQSAEAGQGPVARVRQQLDGESVLTLVQGRAEESRPAWPVPSEGAIESRRVGDLLITATAPVSADSLTALLDGLR